MNFYCRLFGHKYSLNNWKYEEGKKFYGANHCVRCGHYRFEDQKITLSKNVNAKTDK